MDGPGELCLKTSHRGLEVHLLKYFCRRGRQHTIKELHAADDVSSRLIREGTSRQHRSEPEEDSEAHWEVLNPIEGCEVQVGLQVADSVAPGAMGEPLLTQGTALRPQLPPAGLVCHIWNYITISNCGM